MKPTITAVLAVLLPLMAGCNNEPQDRTSETTEPNPEVQTDRNPDTGTGGPVPETPKDGDEQQMPSPSN
ncbi:hypothetical protein ATN84_05305 [Paramesorhizobium deserti]|uniref:Lipoprotein n=1 Tax=Paramesorhizobium deserti TaxID=1494590 RepID=A0A135I133_9HYPH|nr:hypothetical protein [Paramesorhizobium deserti]KXF79149.1 hypothetical protein ATN84_05305 [Paramesorhizobium deserti]